MAPDTSPMQLALQEELQSIERIMSNLQQKREAIQKLLGVYGTTEQSGQSDPVGSDILSASKAKSGMNTIEMARVIIRNAGRPLKPEDVRANIRATFGVDAAKTLYDMLLKRARSENSGFYRTSEGEIGLTEMLPKFEKVGLQSQAAVA
jgi:hypothetical protein